MNPVLIAFAKMVEFECKSQHIINIINPDYTYSDSTLFDFDIDLMFVADIVSIVGVEIDVKGLIESAIHQIVKPGYAVYYLRYVYP